MLRAVDRKQWLSRSHRHMGAPRPGASALVTLKLAFRWNHDGSCGPTQEMLENLACVLRFLKPQRSPVYNVEKCQALKWFLTVLWGQW